MAEWSVTGATPEQRRAVADGLDDTRTWVDPNGYVLSERLWNARAADRRAIDTVLRRALAAGLSPMETARVLERYLTPEGMARRTSRPVGQRFDREAGAWVENLSARGNYAARRLARTEMARAYGRATLESAARNPWTRGVKWNLNQRHDVDDPCDQNAMADDYELGPGVYPPDAFPRFPQHPHCLCFITKVAAPFDEVLATAREELAGGGSAAAFVAGLEAALTEQEPIRANPRSDIPPYMPAANAEEATNYAKLLGVEKVDFTERVTGKKKLSAAVQDLKLEAMNVTNQALSEMAEQGFRMPKEIRVFMDIYHPDAIMFYNPQDGSLNLNMAQYRFWTDRTGYMEQMRKDGWFTAQDEFDLVVHEMGHSYHLGVGDKSKIEAGKIALTTDEQLTAQQISRYASTTRGEFVAETFVELYKGNQVSEAVLQQYRQFGGPEL